MTEPSPAPEYWPKPTWTCKPWEGDEQSLTHGDWTWCPKPCKTGEDQGPSLAKPGWCQTTPPVTSTPPPTTTTVPVTTTVTVATHQPELPVTGPSGDVAIMGIAALVVGSVMLAVAKLVRR